MKNDDIRDDSKMLAYIDHIRENLANNILYYRHEKNIPQKELIRRSGLSKATIAKIEKGDANISIDALIRISKALDIALPLLMGENTDVTSIDERYSLSTIKNMYHLLLYLPLFPPELLLSSLIRFDGDVVSNARHSYIDKQLAYLEEHIPQGLARDYVLYKISGDMEHTEQLSEAHTAYMQVIQNRLSQVRRIEALLRSFTENVRREDLYGI